MKIGLTLADGDGNGVVWNVIDGEVSGEVAISEIGRFVVVEGAIHLVMIQGLLDDGRSIYGVSLLRTNRVQVLLRDHPSVWR